MVSIYSVDPNTLIKKVGEKLKKIDIMTPPEWAKFVKTGVFKERPPVDNDWWYYRAAAILRKIYKLGPIGVSKLRTQFGGKQNRGVKPEKFKPASGNIIRTILQQLEKEGLVMPSKNKKKKGRVITPKGQSLLEKTASEILKDIKKTSKPKQEATQDSKEKTKETDEKTTKASKDHENKKEDKIKEEITENQEKSEEKRKNNEEITEKKEKVKK